MIRFWSDSTIGLSWIRSQPHTLHTFVANRVSEIHSVTDVRDWYHVPTQDNPADFISRGQLHAVFNDNNLWINGPSWLQHSEYEWSKSYQHTRKRTKIVLTCTEESAEILQKFSSLRNLNRFVAYLRLVNKLKSRTSQADELSAEEIESAHLRIIKLTQINSFTHEINDLQCNKPLRSNSRILIFYLIFY